MVRIIYQLCKIKLTGVVELISGYAIHRLCRICRIRLELLYHFLFCWCQCALKSADDNHRNDNILVFVTLVSTAQFVCDRPDKIYLCGNVNRGVIPIASIVCFSAIAVSSIHRDLISLSTSILILIVSHNQDSVFIIIL